MARARVTGRASWKALRHPGTESAVLAAVGGGWRLSGAAHIRFPEGDTDIRYAILCNERWEPRSVEIGLRTSSERRRITIEVDRDREWTVGGFRNPELSGCTDIDFAASPGTNTLTLNRLGLPVGGRAEIRTAYVVFPDVMPIAVRQRYTRLAERRYFFEGLHNGFEREFQIDEHGWVSDYPGGWKRTETAKGGATRRTRGRAPRR